MSFLVELSRKEKVLSIVKRVDPELYEMVQERPTDVLYHNEILPDYYSNWNELMDLALNYGIEIKSQVTSSGDLLTLAERKFPADDYTIQIIHTDSKRAVADCLLLTLLYGKV